MKTTSPLRRSVTLFSAAVLLGNLPLEAAVSYSFNVTSGSWGVDANWSPASVPDDLDESSITIGSGRTADVNDGSYEGGYVYVGSSGVLNVSGAGNGLTIGNVVHSNGNSVALSGNGGVLTVSNGAAVTGAGRFILGDGVTPDSVRTPRLEITNASASFSTLQFAGGNANVHSRLILNEGAQLSLSSFNTGSASGGFLTFNGGVSGFGQLDIVNFEANKVVNLLINPGTYTGTGSFTLVDANAWSGAFTNISLNGSTYTLGTDLLIGERTWNVSLSGSDLVLNVVPEPGVASLLLGVGLLLIMRVYRRTSRC